MSVLSLSSIEKSYGAKAILRGIDLTLTQGEFVVLLGPSGCGKSTLLRIIAGLDRPTSGQVRINGKDASDMSPKDRRVAMVFQNFALYPHMTVFENIAFPLQMQGERKISIRTRVNEIAALLQIEEQLEKKPGQLSGGQKQRVAIGRALVRKPTLFLFDEPLANLDTQLRVRMRSEIAQIHKKSETTSIYVTHDQVEAMTLADRILILNNGVVEQQGTPAEIYGKPATKFVGEFMGSPPMNFISLSNQISPTGSLPPSVRQLGFRPREVKFVKQADDLDLGSGTVTHYENLGADAHVHVQLNGGGIIVADCPVAGAPKIGQSVHLNVNSKSILYFDVNGRAVT